MVCATDSLLVAAGAFASPGRHLVGGTNVHLNIGVLLVGCFAAAALGAEVGYLIGAKAGPALFNRPDSRFFKPAHVARAQHYFDHYGNVTVVLARFIPVVRTFANPVAGVGRMDLRTFTVFNVIDHRGVAERAGVQMPDSKLVMFGKPAVGAAVMVAAPLAALDIPLKVLVWEDRNGAVSVSYNSPGFLAGRHHLEGALRAPFDAVESIVEALPGA